MQLHPQARLFLAESWPSEKEKALVPGEPTFDVDRLRREFAERLGPDARSADFRRIEVDGLSGRLVRPRAGAPVLVYLHGGGWVLGSPRDAEPLCRGVAERSGWAVLAIEYRLAPEHPYPAAILDVERALDRLPAIAEDLGIDATRVAVAGDSAGANIAAGCALRARDAGREPWLLQALLYPIVDLVDEAPSREQFAAGYGLDRSVIAWHVAAYAPDPSDRLRPDVSPLRAKSLAGLPPALVVTAGFDPLRDEGEIYAARLAAEGVPTVCVRFPDVLHGFANPQCFDAAEALFDLLAGALRRAGSA